MSALQWVWSVAAGASALAWVASLVTRDTSWVDRSWSILPVLYTVIIAAGAHFSVLRLNVMAILVTLWGARLTFNFARKGGYSGVEDYRWAVVRAAMTPRRFQLFNLVFIVVYQNILLVLLALPADDVARHRQRPWGPVDVVLTVLFLALLVGETVADQQQWDFHREKRRILAGGGEVTPGFLREGLFRYSRHPNYFFEIAQWWVVAAFAVAATHSLLRANALGAALLTLLFVGSTRFTESISAAKYPLYANYRHEVSAIVPWRPRHGDAVRRRGAAEST